MSKKNPYEQLLGQIKLTYKPRLKRLSKGKLIDLIIDLSAQVALLKQQLGTPNSENKETQTESKND